jgi:predicted RNase H-like HicB family nuclease
MRRSEAIRGARMLQNYTAKYTEITSGYRGQLIEWPEVVTEGKDVEECRAMVRDALNEMLLAYTQQKKNIPRGGALIEQVPVEIQDVGQAA